MKLLPAYINLLNSLKFSRNGLPPVIELKARRVHAAESQGLHGTAAKRMFIETEVKDNGIGFNPRYADAIFKTFTRLNKRSEYEGTGLGSALCKNIMQRHNGFIQAEGKEGTGAIFTLLRHILHKVVPSENLAIVPDGKALLNFLSNHLPQILVLDVNMPGNNEMECLQEIRQNEAFASLLVVIYSSSEEKSAIQKSYACNADLYMVKPHTTEHLKNALEMVLQKQWWQVPPAKTHYFSNNRFMQVTA